MSPIQPSAYPDKNPGSAPWTNYRMVGNLNPSAPLSSSPPLMRRSNSVSAVPDAMPLSPLSSLKCSTPHLSSIAETGDEAENGNLYSSRTGLLESPPQGIPTPTAHSLGGEVRESHDILGKLQKSIAAGANMVLELIHHPLSSVDNEGLSQCSPPVFPADAMACVTPEYITALMEYVKRELSACSRQRLEEQYYASEKAMREDSVEELLQQLGKLEQDICYMSSQSSMHTEKKRRLFQKSDQARSSYNHEMSDLRRKRERVEHKRKLIDLDIQRLEKMERRK